MPFVDQQILVDATVNNERDLERIEQLLRETAADLRGDCPPTPPIAAYVHRRLAGRRAPIVRLRLIRAAALAAVAALALLLASPDVRQAVARFFGLDTVRVERVPTLDIPVTATPVGAVTLQPGTTSPPDELAGLTTLADARQRANFSIRLPAYPDNLGDPQRVYYQDFAQTLNNAEQVILFYPDFALYEAKSIIYQKSIGEATIVEETKVNGRQALWLSGSSHLVELESASGGKSVDFVRVVTGNVLAWETGEVTYRLETELPLDEAIRVAESIR